MQLVWLSRLAPSLSPTPLGYRYASAWISAVRRHLFVLGTTRLCRGWGLCTAPAPFRCLGTLFASWRNACSPSHICALPFILPI